MMFPGTAKKTRWQCSTGLCVLGICGLALTGSALAMQASGPVPGDSSIPRATHSVHPATRGRRIAGKRQTKGPEKKPENPTSPADTLAQPATVTLKNGELTVKANNSDLAQILREVSTLSGMTIDGLHTSDRIFGVYGPGNPSDVLTALLSGSRYNFILVGDRRDGAPQKLLLTAKTVSAPNAARASSVPPPSETPVETPPPPVVQDTEDPETREARVQRMMRRLEAQHEQQQENAAPQ